MIIVIIIILLFSSVCFGDVFDSHLTPRMDDTLTVGSETLFWHFFYGNAFTDGTAYWESNKLYGFSEIDADSIVALVDLYGETITGTTLNVTTITGVDILGTNITGTTVTGDTITDGTFVVSGGEISAGEIINTFGDIDIGGNTLTSWDIYTGQIISHSTSDPQLLLRHTTGVDEASFYVDSFGDLSIDTTGDDISFNDDNIVTDGTITAVGLTVTGSTVMGLDSAIFQPATDATTFFQVLDADGGIPVFNVDSTNERIGIKVADPVGSFQISTRIFFDYVDAFPVLNDAVMLLMTDGGGVAPFDEAGSIIYRSRLSDDAGRSSHIFYTGSVPTERFKIDEGGDVDTGGTLTAGNLTTAGTTDTGLIIVDTHTPGSSGAAGTAGTITWDSNYVYIAVANNSWKRAALSAWGITGENMVYEDGNNMVYEDGNNMIYD